MVIAASLLSALALGPQVAAVPVDQANDPPVYSAELRLTHRKRVMTLVRQGDCDGAISAVYVTGDSEMFELVESQCPVSVDQFMRWVEEHEPADLEPWRNDPIIEPAVPLARSPGSQQRR